MTGAEGGRRLAVRRPSGAACAQTMRGRARDRGNSAESPLLPFWMAQAASLFDRGLARFACRWRLTRRIGSAAVLAIAPIMHGVMLPGS
jgi:hypothetical protein